MAEERENNDNAESEARVVAVEANGDDTRLDEHDRRRPNREASNRASSTDRKSVV